MKLRIIQQHNNKFVCQKRFLWIWWNFVGGYTDITIEYDYQCDAEKFMENYITEQNIKNTPKKIIKEYTIPSKSDKFLLPGYGKL